MIAAKLAAMGLWPQAFTDIGKVVAAGTTLDTAGVAAAASTVMIVGGTGGVNIPDPGAAGDTMMVINATAAVVNVYNGKLGQINGTANPFSVGIGHAVTLLCLMPKQWFVVADVALTGTIPTDETAPSP